jgi:hypothetical protein
VVNRQTSNIGEQQAEVKELRAKCRIVVPTRGRFYDSSIEAQGQAEAAIAVAVVLP